MSTRPRPLCVCVCVMQSSSWLCYWHTHWGGVGGEEDEYVTWSWVCVTEDNEHTHCALSVCSGMSLVSPVTSTRVTSRTRDTWTDTGGGVCVFDWRDGVQRAVIHHKCFWQRAERRIQTGVVTPGRRGVFQTSGSFQSVTVNKHSVSGLTFVGLRMLWWQTQVLLRTAFCDDERSVMGGGGSYFFFMLKNQQQFSMFGCCDAFEMKLWLLLLYNIYSYYYYYYYWIMLFNLFNAAGNYFNDLHCWVNICILIFYKGDNYAAIMIFLI